MSPVIAFQGSLKSPILSNFSDLDVGRAHTATGSKQSYAPADILIAICVTATVVSVLCGLWTEYVSYKKRTMS